MLETEFILEKKPNKERRIENERVSYEYVKRALSFDKAFKFYSPVLKGLPDFIVSEVGLYPLKAGFYEVKFKNRPLSTQQIKVLNELKKIASCYIIRVFPNGNIIVEKIK